MNQALVATAIGLPPTYFRRLLQNNAATTVLDFQPNDGGPPRVNVDRLNQVGNRLAEAVFFQRLLQNNSVTTVLDFKPNDGDPPRVNADRLNMVGSHLAVAAT